MRRLYVAANTSWANRQEHEDDVLAFFIHCHHIRDWIVALNKLNVTSAEVTEFVEGHDCLKICADLCNGTKHCKLTRKHTPKQPRIMGSTHATSSSGGAQTLKGTSNNCLKIKQLQTSARC